MNKHSLLLFFILSVFVYQNCTPYESINSGEFNFASGSSAEFPQIKAILDAKCVTCHIDATPQNRNVSLVYYQAILDSDIILGAAEDSILYISVANGSMPQGMPALSLNETEAIRTWINSGAPSDDGRVANQLPVINMPADLTVELPVTNIEILADVRDFDGQVLQTVWSQVSGPNTANFSGDRTTSLIVNNVQEGDYIFELLVEDDFGAKVTGRINLHVNPAPAPPPSPTFSFANDVNPILQASCVSCHGGANPTGAFSVESYNQVITRVNFGNLTGSELYLRINGGTMPPQGQTPLDANQINIILTWVQEGAPNN